MVELELELEVRGTPALVADRLLSGTDVDAVAEVLRREKIGHKPPPLLLLVRVQLERDEVVPVEDHERRGGQASAPAAPGVTGPAAAAGLPCGTQFGGGLVMT